MPCYFPLQAVRLQDLHPGTGNRRIKVLGSIARCYDDFLKANPDIPAKALAKLLKRWQSVNDAYWSHVDADDLLQVPCGKCVGCRLERSRQWAVRCVHEASLYDDRNCFITLTFNDQFLPRDRSLSKSIFQDFMKRLRKRYVKTVPKHYDDASRDKFLFENGIRYFHCGEYGETYGRPHYHAILFNHVFDDIVLYKRTATGCDLYTSECLQRLWSCPETGRPFGFATVGSMTFDSAAYCARYIMKKVTGEAAEEHYKGRLPEYTTMSRAPGIAKRWFDQFFTDVYPKDYFKLKKDDKLIEMRPPRYYDNQFELLDECEMLAVKEARKLAAAANVSDNTPERLHSKHKKKLLDINRLIRNVDAEQ